MFSTEPWDRIQRASPAEALTAELARAAGWWIKRCRSRGRASPPNWSLRPTSSSSRRRRASTDAARARAAGDEVRTVIAGYHWFTDWGRDTMISLEGLTLVTGRHAEAGYILRTFAQLHQGRTDSQPLSREASRRGSITPPTRRCGTSTPSTATSTRPTTATRCAQLLPKLQGHHSTTTCAARGSALVSIRTDGLLRQGAEGYQLTWMDAKVGDWVVTPRRGKAVEINALWYNALRLMERWVREEEGEEAASGMSLRTPSSAASRSTAASGMSRVVISSTCLMARTEENDSSLRPNQVFAISLDHPILDRSRWKPVLNVVREKLLTPVGLRSLSPGSPDYKPKYFGDLRARDAAYHQGTVWAWLIGPFVDAWMRANPEDRGWRCRVPRWLPPAHERGVCRFDQ